MADVGRIYDKGTMLLREEVGTGTWDEVLTYELATVCGHATPLIRSRKTGKWFSLSWADIIRLAIAAGIDRE